MIETDCLTSLASLMTLPSYEITDCVQILISG